MKSLQKVRVISFYLILLCAVTLFLSSGCRQQITHQVSRIYLGTIINITIIADSHDVAANAAEAAFAEIARIESLLSPKSESGDVARANRYASKVDVQISEETFRIIERAKGIWQKTDGAFDITFASIAHLWNFGKKPFMPPSRQSVLSLLDRIDSGKLVLDHNKKTVHYKKAGIKIGLGGIAKGYAIRRAIEIIRSHGIQNAIVEAGGDLMVIGNKSGSLWRVGLAHPRKQEILAAILLEDGQSVATSGDYERFSTYRGRRYHHILDPKTGFPAMRCVSVSVICSDPEMADAYATAFFVMGRQRAFEFMRNEKNLEAIIIEPDMKIYASESLKGKVHIQDMHQVCWVGVPK